MAFENIHRKFKDIISMFYHGRVLNTSDITKTAQIEEDIVLPVVFLKRKVMWPGPINQVSMHI